jgi:UDP-3-O-[3-hydroxymyristoyl] glucosamine N-acyltransferase
VRARIKLREIAEALAARVVGDDTLAVDRIVHPLDARGPGDLAVAIAEEARAALEGCGAAAVIVSDDRGLPEGKFGGVIVADGGRGTLAALGALFDSGPAHGAGIHPTAVIASDATIGTGASIGPYASVGGGSRIGAGSVVLGHVTIGDGAQIGDHCILHPGVRLADRVTLGDRVVVHANAVIGSDGFSFVPGPQGARKVHALGSVIVGDDVEIGACTTIDRATLRATRVGRGTKIDNLVQIGHNVEIGEDCLICALVGIAGSVRIGDRVVLAGRVGIADHISVGADAQILAGSGVGSNVPAGAQVSGYPAMRHERTKEIILFSGRQKALHGKVEALEARLRELEKAGTHKDG